MNIRDPPELSWRKRKIRKYKFKIIVPGREERNEGEERNEEEEKNQGNYKMRENKSEDFLIFNNKDCSQ
jgi:hypothetical protein